MTWQIYFQRAEKYCLYENSFTINCNVWKWPLHLFHIGLWGCLPWSGDSGTCIILFRYSDTTVQIPSTVAVVVGWGYRASDQRRWAVLHPACGGRQQSPIAIAARQAIPISIPAMELIGYQNPLPGPLTITNNGHSGNFKLQSLFIDITRFILNCPTMMKNDFTDFAFLSSCPHHPEVQFRRGKERFPSPVHLRWSPWQWVRNRRPPLPLGRQEQPRIRTYPERYAPAFRNAHHPQKQEV